MISKMIGDWALKLNSTEACDNYLMENENSLNHLRHRLETEYACSKDKHAVNQKRWVHSVLGKTEADELSKLTPDQKDYWVTQREAHLFRMFDEILKTENVKNVAILYGAAHMKSIENHLISQHNYELFRENWLDALFYQR